MLQICIKHRLKIISAASNDHRNIISLQTKADFGAQFGIEFRYCWLCYFLRYNHTVLIYLLVYLRVYLNIAVVCNLWNSSSYVDSIFRVSHASYVFDESSERVRTKVGSSPVSSLASTLVVWKAYHDQLIVETIPNKIT